MRNRGRGILVIVLAIVLAVGVLAVVQADPGNGKGKGAIGKNCKKCPPAPENCVFFECDNHWCNYECMLPDGTFDSLTLPKK